MINLIYRLKNFVLPTNSERLSNEFAEQKMMELLERYRSIIDSQPSFICRFLLNGTISFANQAFCDYYCKTREEIIGANISSFIPQKEFILNDLIENLSEDNPVIVLYHQVYLPNQEERWHRGTYTMVLSHQNSFHEIQYIGQEIANKKGLAPYLNNTAYDACKDYTFDVIGLPVVVLEPDLTIFACNHLFEQFCGYSGDDLKEKELFSVLVVPDLLEIVLVYKLLPTEPKDFEVQCIDRYGNIKDVIINTSCLDEDGKLVLTFIDITKKYIDNNLSKAIDDNSIIVVCNTSGDVLAVNKMCEDLVGLLNYQVRGMKYWDAFCADEDKGMNRILFKRIIAGRDAIEIKQKWLTGSGEIEVLIIKHIPILNVKGKIEYVIISGKVVPE